MGYNGGMITRPVSIEDVQKALGTSKNDLGQLCQLRGNIKTWARFRPIEYKSGGATGNPYVKMVNDADRARVNWGITAIPIWGSNKTLANMVYFWAEGHHEPGRSRPDGYENAQELPNAWWDAELPTTAFRLTDFVSSEYPDEMGYFVRANPPIGGILMAGTENDATGEATIQYEMNLDGVVFNGHQGPTLFYSDLSIMNTMNFQDMYFGVVIIVGTGSSAVTYLATQDNKVGDVDGSTITLWSMGPTVRFKIGTTSGAIKDAAMNATPVKVFPVMSSTKSYYGIGVEIQPANDNMLGPFVALNDCENAVFTLTYIEGVVNNLQAWKDPQMINRLVYYNFWMTCSDATTDHTFDIKIEVRDANNQALPIAGNPVTITRQILAGQQIAIADNINAGNYYNSAAILYVETKVVASETSPITRVFSTYTNIYIDRQ